MIGRSTMNKRSVDMTLHRMSVDVDILRGKKRYIKHLILVTLRSIKPVFYFITKGGVYK